MRLASLPFYLFFELVLSVFIVSHLRRTSRRSDFLLAFNGGRNQRASSCTPSLHPSVCTISTHNPRGTIDITQALINHFPSSSKMPNLQRLIVAYSQRGHRGVQGTLAVLTKTSASLFVPPPPLHHVDEVVVTSCLPSFAIDLFLD